MKTIGVFLFLSALVACEPKDSASSTPTPAPTTKAAATHAPVAVASEQKTSAIAAPSAAIAAAPSAPSATHAAGDFEDLFHFEDAGTSDGSPLRAGPAKYAPYAN